MRYCGIDGMDRLSMDRGFFSICWIILFTSFFAYVACLSDDPISIMGLIGTRGT